MDCVCVQTADFNLQHEYDALRRSGAGTGAIVTFSGLVRDFSDRPGVNGMYLEHYPGMTEAVLEDLIGEARQRWPLLQVRITHRVGQLQPTDQIVFVGVAASHRTDAFAACEFLMDFLKTQAPFWKKETTPEGSHWVEAKASDDQAAERWE